MPNRVEAAAEMLQLTPYLERLPPQPFGRAAQRVAIGRAIVRDPKSFCSTSRFRTSTRRCVWPPGSKSPSFTAACNQDDDDLCDT